jgi:hypothetical protein
MPLTPTRTENIALLRCVGIINCDFQKEGVTSTIVVYSCQVLVHLVVKALVLSTGRYEGRQSQP